jgi:glyoxylase I family protein
MHFLAIDHPSIACRDVEGQKTWYCENLGMRVVADDGKSPRGYLLGYGPISGGGAMIELMPAKEPGEDPRNFTRFQPGLRHVALRVTDFEQAYEQLRALGVQFLFEPADNAVGGGKIVSFRDPEGNELQIVQRRSRQL